ncbi:hypothetical protein I6F15_23145 [Bradyrhizobium sp. BRP14]|nr:hypothetical protein [Bradyrhizobium sp. BRP14]
MIADLTRDEERFRALMREPVNDPSPAARELAARIEKAPTHDLGALAAAEAPSKQSIYAASRVQ